MFQRYLALESVRFALPSIGPRRPGDPFEAHKKVTEILATAGFTYHSDAEVSSAWDYRNKYGSFR